MTRTKALRNLMNSLNIQDFTGYTPDERKTVLSAIIILKDKLTEKIGKSNTVYKNKFGGVSNEY